MYNSGFAQNNAWKSTFFAIFLSCSLLLLYIFYLCLRAVCTFLQALNFDFVDSFNRNWIDSTVTDTF